MCLSSFQMFCVKSHGWVQTYQEQASLGREAFAISNSGRNTRIEEETQEGYGRSREQCRAMRILR